MRHCHGPTIGPTTIIIQKASRRQYFLKQLKRARLATHHLLDFYIAVVRPVLEYCAPVWHYALTKAQTQELEAIQKRAIHIILNSTQLTTPKEEWINKRKEAKKLIYIPDSLVNSLDVS